MSFFQWNIVRTVFITSSVQVNVVRVLTWSYFMNTIAQLVIVFPLAGNKVLGLHCSGFRSVGPSSSRFWDWLLPMLPPIALVGLWFVYRVVVSIQTRCASENFHTGPPISLPTTFQHRTQNRHSPARNTTHPSQTTQHPARNTTHELGDGIQCKMYNLVHNGL